MDRLTRVWWAALAAVLLFLPAASSMREWRGEHLLSKARIEQRRGNINGASELFRRAVEYGREEAAVALARMAYYRQQWDMVRHHASRALAINPMQGYVHVLLAYAMAAEGGSGGAQGIEPILEECRKAVVHEPANASLWKACADLTMEIAPAGAGGGDDGPGEARYRQEAVRAYRQAIRYDVRVAEGIIPALARSHYDETFLLEVVRGGSAALLLQTVESLLGQGRWDEVREAFWKEAATSPGAYYLPAAEALRRERRYNEAFSVLAAYLSMSPGDAEAHYRAAEINYARGREVWEETKKLYRRALELEPGRTDYRRQFGLRLLGMGEHEEARLQLARAVEEDALDAQAVFYLGRLTEKEGRRDEARSLYRRALSLRPENRAYRRAFEDLR